MGIVTTKPVFGEFTINKDADQHVQPSSLISALVNRLLESIITRLATSEIVSVVLQDGMNLSLSETPNTGFLTSQPIWASTQENLSSGVCEQPRCRPACASVQSDQHLC